MRPKQFLPITAAHIQGVTITGGKRRIDCRNASPTLSHCHNYIFLNNSATGAGGALQVGPESCVAVVNCSFNRNSAGHDGPEPDRGAHGGPGASGWLTPREVPEAEE